MDNFLWIKGSLHKVLFYKDHSITQRIMFLYLCVYALLATHKQLNWLTQFNELTVVQSHF